MRRSLFLGLFISINLSLTAQSIEGRWQGKLSVQGTELTIVFNIKTTYSGYVSTLDSPDQGAFGIPVDSTDFNAPDLRLVIKRLGASYNGSLSENGELSGTFSQAGMTFPLNLKKTKKEAPKKKPQEPVPPFPYQEEEVVFNNQKDQVQLTGTFTFPSNSEKSPAVVLISGSGPQDRNEEIFGHKPFLVLADHLTRMGIAVLRYDDRGTSKSTGDFSKATTFDLANDAEAAFDYLNSREEVDTNFIGLIGHSEGGIIAPLIASRNEQVNFIVLLAGTAIRGDSLLNQQRKMLLEASGVGAETISEINRFYDGIFKIIELEGDLESLNTKMDAYIQEEIVSNPNSALLTSGMNTEDFSDMIRRQLLTPWMINFINYDPSKALKNVSCPVLALNGEKDLQVPVSNLDLIKTFLAEGGNYNVVVKAYPDLNHLFQTCETGLPIEYGKIEETISPEVLSDISAWINKQSIDK